VKHHTNKQLIALCERAKKVLWNGKSDFIPRGKEEWVCMALSTVSPNGDTPDKLGKLVKAHIGNNSLINGKLREEFGYTAVWSMTSKQIQAWRLLMLNNMIKILKEESK